MRIGEFSKKTETSIDTIRHYITLGLLVPSKEGKFFQFDSRCEKDLNRIKEMKEMSFSLQEIKNILLVSRFSKLSLGQERQHYRSFFRNKLKALKKEQAKIDTQIHKIEKKISDLDVQFVVEPVTLGVNLSFLMNFYCPDCQTPLTLDDAEIKNNMIMNGVMNCSCGYRVHIDNGILINKASMKVSEETDETYFIKYIDETDDHFLDNIYTAMEWCHREMDYDKVDHEIVLELGLGHGILLSHIYNDLPDTTTYIAVDYDYSKIKYVKKVLERSGIKKNILFICADYRKIPIKPKSVGYVVDFLGMSNYSFTHNEVLHEVSHTYYKDKCILLGSYMFFDKFKDKSALARENYHLFKKDNINNYLSNYGFKCKEDCIFGYSEVGARHDVSFDITNRVYMYGYLGER